MLYRLSWLPLIAWGTSPIAGTYFCAQSSLALDQEEAIGCLKEKVPPINMEPLTRWFSAGRMFPVTWACPTYVNSIANPAEIYSPLS